MKAARAHKLDAEARIVIENQQMEERLLKIMGTKRQPIEDVKLNKRSVLLLELHKGRFWNNSQIDKLISKRLSVENKAKLSQPTRA